MTRPPIWDETKRWWALSALVICILVIGLDTTVLYVALPELVESLQTTNSELQWVFNSYLLVFAGLMLPFGAFADRVGRKRMLFVGLIVFGLASAGATIASEPAGLITARAFMGVGAAIIMPVSLSMLSVLFAPEERARAHRPRRDRGPMTPPPLVENPFAKPASSRGAQIRARTPSCSRQ